MLLIQSSSQAVNGTSGSAHVIQDSLKTHGILKFRLEISTKKIFFNKFFNVFYDELWRRLPHPLDDPKSHVLTLWRRLPIEIRL